MEKKGNKLVGLFDAEAQVLIQIGELRAKGHEEENLYLVAKHDEQIPLLIEHTAVHVDTEDRDNFKGKVIAFLSGEDITKDAFNRMGLEETETDYYFQQVETGKLLLYTDCLPAAIPVDSKDDHPHPVEEQKPALQVEHPDIGKEIQVPVERGEAVIDRRPISKGAEAANGDQVLSPKEAYEKGDAIYIPLSEERLDIGKKKVVREEIVIGKRKVKDVQVINETVRRETADIEEKGIVPKTDKP